MSATPESNAHTYIRISYPPSDSCTPRGFHLALIEPSDSSKSPFHQSAMLFIKHLRESSLLNTRITFEIPPVTSQPPKHGSRGLKYLCKRKKGGGFPSVGTTGIIQAAGVEAKVALLQVLFLICFYDVRFKSIFKDI